MSFVSAVCSDFATMNTKWVLIILVITLSVIDVNGARNKTEKIEKSNLVEEPVTEKDTTERSNALFPRHMRKFMITPQPAKSARNTPYTFTKRPLMLKLVPKQKVAQKIEDWQATITRKPLMKSKKFTVTPKTEVSAESIDKINNNKRRSLNLSNFHVRDIYRKNVNKLNKLTNKINDLASEEDSSEEKDMDDDILNENFKEMRSAGSVKNMVFVKPDSPQEKNKEIKAENKISKSQNIQSNKKIISSHVPIPSEKLETTSRTVSPTYSSEEKADRKEFIFMKPKQIASMLAEKDESSIEVATDNILEEHEGRSKRSVNVIEEENLATTISGFKYTGRVSSLNNDLAYRNINA